MAQIRVKQLGDVIHRLPGIVECNPVADHFYDTGNLFLCVLGFEERTLSIPQKLHEAGYKADRVVVIQYATNETDNELNWSLLEESLIGISDTITRIVEGSEDFTERFRELVCDFRGSEGKANVMFDISVAANRLVVKCMNALIESKVDLTLVYSEAAIYYPTREQYEGSKEKLLSEDTLGLDRGVDTIMSSIGHPGNHLDPLPDCIFIFPSFSAERSWATINKIDPSLGPGPGDKVVWLIGIPHDPTDLWRKDAMMAINKIKPPMKKFEVSTFDYKDSLTRLESLYQEKWECCNISVLPLGSKMQAVGVSLFCHLRRDVKLMYAVPKTYNAAEYSTGCRSTWKIAFGNMAQIREILGEIGQIEIV